MVIAWMRFDTLPHGKLLYALSLCWPLLLFEDLLRMAGASDYFASFVGISYFVPVLLMAGLVKMVFPLIDEKPIAWKPLTFIAVGIIVLCQIPVLIYPFEQKLALLNQQPIGSPLANAPVYIAYGLSGLFIVAMGIKLADAMRNYQETLSEQVVDISYYRVPAIAGLVASLVGVGFAATVLTALVAFGFFQFNAWQTLLHYAYALVFLMIFLVMLERRRYSPLPLDLSALAARSGDEQRLRETLAKAEKTMISRKAYKVIGLRIRQLADAAGVPPTELAIAIRTLLNRNFRAFVYHYRLEYAKKVLMQTDAKVSAVARKLGFDSEKFLSDMFIQYIQKMGARSGQTFEDPLDTPEDDIFADPANAIKSPSESQTESKPSS